MRVRSFTAPSMPEVMAMVRAEMGEDAVILSSERSRRGIEVKAAAERPAANLENVDAAYSRLAALEAELERRLVAAVAEPEPALPPPVRDPWTPDSVAAKLAFHELRADFIVKLMSDSARFTSGPGPEALAQALDKHIAFAPLPAELETTLVLIGQPGAGKTAAAAKIAVRAVLAGRPAALVTTDASAGSLAQIESFAGLIRLPVEAAADPDALRSTVERLTAEDPTRALIVDTQGVNPFDRAELTHLRRLIAACGQDAEPVFVAAAQGGRDIEDQAVIFKALGARRLIATRLDVARRLGGLIGAADVAGLALAQGSASPYIAETMEPLNPFALARRLLTGDPAAPLTGARS
jgi:flagellar biosynthesis protein FlhF